LLTLRVTNAPLYNLGLVDTVDRAGQDDERSDLGLLVGLNDGEIDISVKCGVGERVDEKKGRLRGGVGPQVGVDGLGGISTLGILFGRASSKFTSQ